MLPLFFSMLVGSPFYGQALSVGYEPSHAKVAVASTLESSSADDVPEDSPEPAPRSFATTVQGAVPTREVGPLQSWKLAFNANTLGAGFEVSTPLARHFDLRGGANFLSFGPAFDVDGLHYDSSIHLRSGRFGLDWFPRHGNFRIHGGIMYFNNNVTALTHVAPGGQFTLDDNPFTSDASDPVHGDAGLTYSRHVAPTLTVGFNNILPGRHAHISVPLEFGVAFTGSPKINATLAGTACEEDGCFKFEENDEAQQSLKNELKDINDTLSDIPVYPILSLGFAYRF